MISRLIIPTLAILAGLGLVPTSPAQQPAPDWQAEVRSLLAAGRSAEALAVADWRLEQMPGDLEARAWRGRALVRLDRLPEAESEFRRVLAAAPNDTDILLDIGNLLARQQHFAEAIEQLDRARQLDRKRADVEASRGRVLRALGRASEARSAFRDAERLEPGNPEAKEGLASLAEEPRHELRMGTDIDTFNYTDTAGAFTTSLRSNWSSRWVTNFSSTYYDRFGAQAARFTGSVTFKPTRHDGISVGAVSKHDEGVIPKSEAFFELDHGLSFAGKPFVRGLEFNYGQRWLWYSTARILTLTPALIAYLPRDWIWSFNITEARSSFPGIAPIWQTSGNTKLQFPMLTRLSGNVFFAVGSEDFSRVDQIGRFSARAWGGGMRWDVTRRQSMNGYVLNQDRTQVRSQTSFGFSYGFRF